MGNLRVIKGRRSRESKLLRKEIYLNLVLYDKFLPDLINYVGLAENYFYKKMKLQNWSAVQEQQIKDFFKPNRFFTEEEVLYGK